MRRGGDGVQGEASARIQGTKLFSEALRQARFTLTDPVEGGRDLNSSQTVAWHEPDAMYLWLEGMYPLALRTGLKRRGLYSSRTV